LEGRGGSSWVRSQASPFGAVVEGPEEGKGGEGRGSRYRGRIEVYQNISFLSFFAVGPGVLIRMYIDEYVPQ